MKIWKRTLSVGLSLALCGSMVLPGLAASFSDLNDAISGSETGTQIEGSDRYGYGDRNEETGKWAIEAWDEDDTRKVELNEDVTYNKTEDKGQTSIVVDDGEKVELELNGNKIDGGNRVGDDGKRTDEAGSGRGVVLVTGEDTELTVNDSSALDDEGNYVAGEGTGAITGGYGSTSTQYGGGVSVTHGASFTMNGGSVSDNSSYGHGGGIFMNDGDSVELNGVTVSGNKLANVNGTTQGSAIFAGYRGSGTHANEVVINDSVITENWANPNQTFNGQVIHSQRGDVTITNTKIVDNTGKLAVIRAEDGTTTLTNCEITGNSVDDALIVVDDLVLEDSIIRDNTNSVSFQSVGFGAVIANGLLTLHGNNLVCNNFSEEAYPGQWTPYMYQLVGTVVTEDGRKVINTTQHIVDSEHTELKNADYSATVDVDGDGENDMTYTQVMPTRDANGKIEYTCLHCGETHTTNLYLIRVEGNGANPDSLPDDVVVVDGTAPGEVPEGPTREDYDFDGWVVVTIDPETGEETETPFDPEAPVDGPVVIRPTWTYNPDNSGDGGDGGFDVGGTEVEIEDVDVPLAGLFTRADAIGYLWQQAGEPEAELSDFPDVPEDHQWAVAIGWAQDVGIALPDLEGNFRPDDLVERFVEDAELKPEGELQEFLNRYAVYAGIELDEDELFYELGGEAADIVMGEDAQVIFDDFFAKLEEALADKAA